MKEGLSRAPSRLGAGLMLIGCVVVTGCGLGGGQSSIAGGSAASPTATEVVLPGDASVKACELIPKADLETLLGEGLSDGVPGPGSCKVYSDDGSGGIVVLTVGDWKVFQSAAQGARATALPGVGDEALYDGAAIYARAGGRGFYVKFTSSTDNDSSRRTKASKVANRLIAAVGTAAGTSPTPTVTGSSEPAESPSP